MPVQDAGDGAGRGYVVEALIVQAPGDLAPTPARMLTAQCDDGVFYRRAAACGTVVRTGTERQARRVHAVKRMTA